MRAEGRWRYPYVAASVHLSADHSRDAVGGRFGYNALLYNLSEPYRFISATVRAGDKVVGRQQRPFYDPTLVHGESVK